MSLVFQPSLFDQLDSSPRLSPLESGTVQHIALTDGAWVDLRPGWLLGSDAVFERLVEAVPWRADRREMYDRVVDVPRLVSWFGAGDPLPDPVLDEAMGDLNAYYSTRSGITAEQRFQTAGLCFYRTGDDSVAWHGDRVGRTINRDTMVGILSVGEARVLSLRPKVRPGEVRRFALGHGDLIVMGGSCQRTHEHAILKTAKAVGPRISVQFRPVWPR
ncbi:alpha-ketoglutarate-dependent dioxygenase AlkB [Lacisediminihabitans changchengi]|uniref:Alpha-ketoglutarate-dependent dioxygenase AlkB n=1 Tax=Lacisediminihabitans changchengi TaxID=2787634 RepID=A0A934SJP2_9MICO|nr:alpha-ketoglutarate-dependent dioxygenase AlkB [Lacisediminihabitans changchengi]MBK4346541.1 alpha-ketoglutarate-dependent dioxygenase AlkB [Lacisediminihabitans changchengi]